MVDTHTTILFLFSSYLERSIRAVRVATNICGYMYMWCRTMVHIILLFFSLHYIYTYTNIVSETLVHMRWLFSRVRCKYTIHSVYINIYSLHIYLYTIYSYNIHGYMCTWMECARYHHFHIIDWMAILAQKATRHIVSIQIYILVIPI